MPIRLFISTITISLLASNTYAGTWSQGYWGKMVWGDPEIYKSDLETGPLTSPEIINIQYNDEGFSVELSYDDSSPEQNGWLPITGFNVNCSHTVNQSIISLSSSSNNISTSDQLPQGESYNCQAFAINEAGQSANPTNFKIEMPLDMATLPIGLIHTILKKRAHQNAASNH